MPHRKPLGTTCRTRCRWGCETPPELGAYLVTPAGTTYRVAGVDETRNPTVFGLLLERVAAVGTDGPVYGFEWDKRR